MRRKLTTGSWLAVFLTIWSLSLFGQTPTTPAVPTPGTRPTSVPATGTPAAGSPVAGTPADTSVKPRVLKSVFGTVATDSVPVGPNSSKQKVAVPLSVGDSIRVGESVLTPAEDSLSQGDTTQLSARQNEAIRKIIPRKATLRALTFPGRGQAYNRQYYKIPFVYAGFGAIGYFFIRYSNLYRQYVAGYREAFNLPDTLPAGQAYPNGLLYKNALVRGQALGVAQLKRNTEFTRRYRDLNVILGVLLWGLQAVEANVAAHLKTFDISDDISATWKPTLLPYAGGVAPGLRLTFNFKH